MTSSTTEQPGSGHPDTQASDDRSTASRRIALRTLLAGGGAAAGALAFGKPVAAGPELVELAGTNTATGPTIIEYTGDAFGETGPSVFSAGGYAPPATSPFPAGVGGYGNELVPHGIHGSTTNPAGFGVVAANLGALPDDDAQAPGALAVASLAGPQIVFVALDGAVEGPTPGTHVAGELYRDAAGTLWFTVPAPTEDDPTAIEFVKLAGTPENDAEGTPSAGAFYIIDPQRVYDSRQAGYEERGLLEPNQNRVISVADGRDSGGLIIAPDIVPAGATAVLINLTVDGVTGGNFLQVTDGDTTATETSVLNWDDGAVQLANSITVPVNGDREIRVYCGDQSGSANVIVDVFGYYL